MNVEATAAFFDLIHGAASADSADAWRCLFTLPDRRHHWFTDSAKMAAAALRLDAAGQAVFHSCATFTTKKREQQHVGHLRALWLDIDAGRGKPYGDARAAYRALEEWRATVGLPPCLVVVSGGGLHAYWPLRDPLGQDQWRELAVGLRTLAQQHGLAIDPGSTIDAARILRPPGTHNRKLFDAAGKKIADVGGPPRLVQSGPHVARCGAENLAAIWGSPRGNGVSAVPNFARLTAESPMPELGAAQGFDDASDPAQIAQRCAQMRRLREARGSLPEPEWYAVLGVLSHCGDAGWDAAHEWSEGDSSYVWDDTEAKLAQAQRAAGPTTCARFQVLHPQGCVGCPWAGKITGPIQLGRHIAASVAAPAPPLLTLPPLPSGYRWVGTRLAVERKPTEDDVSPYHIVAEYPIYIDELQETEKGKKVSAVFRSWEPMARAWRDFSAGLGEIVGMGGKSKLADHGVVIADKRWKAFADFVGASTNQHRGTRHYGVRYEQFGWKALPDGTRGFVVGDEMLRRGLPSIRIHGNEEVDRRGSMMAPQGTLAAWSAAANALVGHPGMEPHRFMLLCAFAARLYHFTGEVGAPLVHAVSRGSGRGKTTLLEAGGSVDGMPLATSIIERDTMVAKFVTLGTLGNLPVFFDEMRFPTAEETKHYVLQATLGRDRQRGKAEGGLRADQLTWSTIHISASNVSLTDTVRADGAEVAQAARIFEFPLALPQGLRTSDGDALKMHLKANAGTAGRCFTQAALDHYDWLVAAIPKRMRFYEDALAAGPEARFIIRLFACVDVAAALVRQYNILDIDIGGVMRWALEMQKGAAQRLASEGALDPAAVLSSMINDLLPNTLVMERPQTRGKPHQLQAIREKPRGELKARLEYEGRRMLVDTKAVRSWMVKNNHPYSQIAKELQALGVLLDPYQRLSLGAGSGLTVGQDYCWVIDGAHPLLADLIDGAIAPPENVVQLRGRA